MEEIYFIVNVASVIGGKIIASYDLEVRKPPFLINILPLLSEVEYRII